MPETQLQQMARLVGESSNGLLYVAPLGNEGFTIHHTSEAMVCIEPKTVYDYDEHRSTFTFDGYVCKMGISLTEDRMAEFQQELKRAISLVHHLNSMEISATDEELHEFATWLSSSDIQNNRSMEAYQ